MVKRRPRSTGCPFGEKFAQFLAREDLSLSAFAAKTGLKQRTLHGWVKEGRRVPSDGLAAIVRASGIPADYWTNDALPWPPAVEYVGVAEDLVRRIGSWTMDELRALQEMANDAEDRAQTFALRRAARQHRAP